MKNKRLPPEARGELLLDVALDLAAKHGLYTLTRERIATTARVSEALVSARLGTMPAMRRTVMRQAIARGVLSIVAEGLACRDEHALAAPEDLRQRAAASMAVAA